MLNSLDIESADYRSKCLAKKQFLESVNVRGI